MIVLDYRDRRPLYEQVTEKLEELMFSGVLPPDSRLPSVRSMATGLSINPNTIQRAYAAVSYTHLDVYKRQQLRLYRFWLLRKGMSV